MDDQAARVRRVRRTPDTTVPRPPQDLLQRSLPPARPPRSHSDADNRTLGQRAARPTGPHARPMAATWLRRGRDQPTNPKAAERRPFLFHKESNPMKSMQDLRITLADRRLRIDAAAEVGKLGLKFDFEAGNNVNGRSEMLARRADLRRVVNALSQATRELLDSTPATKWSADDQKSYDAKLNAVTYLHTEIDLISNMIDLEEWTPNGSSRAKHNAPELRDSNGQRVGSVLTTEMLATEHEIAARLNISNAGDTNLGDFFRGVAKMKSSEGIRAALSEGTDSAGGYTVPEVLMPRILSALVPASSLLTAGASLAVLGTDAKTFTLAGVDSIPTAAWRSEAGAVAESDPAFRAIVVTPRSLAFRFKVSRELLQDSPNIDEALQQAIAQAFAKEMDRAGLRGTGTAPEIRGLKNISGINTVTNGTNGASPTSYANFVSAWQEIVSDNAPAPRAAIMHPRDMAKFANLADSTGQPLRRPELLDTMRFVQTSQIPTNLTVGSSSDTSEIYVGDFSQFVFFLREGVSVQMLNELYAATGEIGFVCHARVDVAALYPQAFALVTGVRA